MISKAVIYHSCDENREVAKKIVFLILMSGLTCRLKFNNNLNESVRKDALDLIGNI